MGEDPLGTPEENLALDSFFPMLLPFRPFRLLLCHSLVIETLLPPSCCNMREKQQSQYIVSLCARTRAPQVQIMLPPLLIPQARNGVVSFNHRGEPMAEGCSGGFNGRAFECTAAAPHTTQSFAAGPTPQLRLHCKPALAWTSCRQVSLSHKAHEQCRNHCGSCY